MNPELYSRNLLYILICSKTKFHLKKSDKRCQHNSFFVKKGHFKSFQNQSTHFGKKISGFEDSGFVVWCHDLVGYYVRQIQQPIPKLQIWIFTMFLTTQNNFFKPCCWFLCQSSLIREWREIQIMKYFSTKFWWLIKVHL